MATVVTFIQHNATVYQGELCLGCDSVAIHDLTDNFCSIGWVRLAIILLHYFSTWSITVHMAYIKSLPLDLSKTLTPTDDEIQQFICGMSLDNDIVVDIGKSTQKQADSNLWLAMHNERITSSQFGEISCCKDTTDPSVLVKSLMGYKRKTRCISRWFYYLPSVDAAVVSWKSSVHTAFMAIMLWSCHHKRLQRNMVIAFAWQRFR